MEMQMQFSGKWIYDNWRKRLNSFLNRSFSPDNEGVTWNAISILVGIFKKDPYSKNGKRAKNYLGRLRKRFVNLELDDFLRVLISYYQPGKGASQILFDFDIANILGYTCLGDYEGAKKIFEKVLQGLHSFPLMYDVLENEENLGSFISASSFLFSLIAEISIIPTWKNLIECAFQGDKQAKNIIKDIFAFIAHQGFGLDLVPDSQWALKKGKANFSYAGVLKIIGYFGDEKILKFPVPSEREEIVGALLEEVRGNILIKNQAIISGILAFFRENIEKYSEIFDKMWNEISESPKYGIRQGGKDRIDIGIDSLKMNGYQTLQFFDEGCTFPDVKVKFWLQLFSHSSSCYCSFGFLLQKDDLLSYNIASLPEEDPRVWVDRLLAFMSLHSYWRIIMGKNDKIILNGDIAEKKKKSRRTGKGAGGSKKESLWTVRPHIRRLFPGWRASDKAAALYMEEKKQPLPHGFTFVREHKRGFEDMIESTKSLFTYREEDMGYLV